MASISTRSRVIPLYKQLIYLGRDYPKDPDQFRHRIHNAFWKNKDVKDPEMLEELIVKGQYIVKELEALYMLKKYRTLKRRYYDDNNQTVISYSAKEKQVDQYIKDNNK